MKQFIVVVSLLLLVHSGIPTNGLELVSGKTILVFNGGGISSPEINGFYANYTSAGNQVINGTDLTVDSLRTLLTSDVDSLFLPANDLSGENLTFIKEWFDLGGRILWVAGDSDFGGYFISDNLNPVLETVGSVLRLDSGAVNDPTSNDGASYRVIATQLGNGSVSDAIRTEIVGNFKMYFHAPTAVYYLNNNSVPSDLREESLDNVEVVVKSSPDAVAIDQDLSAGSGDFYSSINAVGNLPLLAVETIGSNVVIVSGDSVFKDFKNMYGNTLPHSGEFHHGSIVVDTLLSYLWQEVIPSLESNSTNSETTSNTTTTQTTIQSNITTTTQTSVQSSTATSTQTPVQETPSRSVPVSIMPIMLMVAGFVPLRKRILNASFSK